MSFLSAESSQLFYGQFLQLFSRQRRKRFFRRWLKTGDKLGATDGAWENIPPSVDYPESLWGLGS